MLELKVGEQEVYNEGSSEFSLEGGTLLQLEHSLVSIAAWESKWEKPFLSDSEKSDEEMVDYIRFMTLTENVDPIVYTQFSQENFTAINQYIQAKMTATFFNEIATQQRRKKEIITAEIVYHWIVALQIDWEVQYWHFNRLLTLVKVLNAKNQPEKKSTTPNSDFIAKRKAMNAKRRAQTGSKG